MKQDSYETLNVGFYSLGQMKINDYSKIIIISLQMFFMDSINLFYM